MTDRPPAGGAGRRGGQPARPATAAPLGHSASAHQLLGWCSHCPTRSAAQEVTAWRGWANTLLHTINEGVCSGA